MVETVQRGLHQFYELPRVSCLSQSSNKKKIMTPMLINQMSGCTSNNVAIPTTYHTPTTTRISFVFHRHRLGDMLIPNLSSSELWMFCPCEVVEWRIYLKLCYHSPMGRGPTKREPITLRAMHAWNFIDSIHAYWCNWACDGDGIKLFNISLSLTNG